MKPLEAYFIGLMMVIVATMPSGIGDMISDICIDICLQRTTGKNPLAEENCLVREDETDCPFPRTTFVWFIQLQYLLVQNCLQ